ncbi:hypothetical protein LG302_16225 [Halomonas organivorans]
MCPIEGQAQPTALSLSRLVSKALLVVRLGGLSDAIRFNALQPELTLSSLGDILFKNDFGELVAEPLLERLLGEKFIESAPKQRNNYDEPVVIPETKSSIDNRFWEIWHAEMGFTLDQARNIIGLIEDFAIESKTLVIEIKRSKIIQIIIDESVTQEVAKAFLDKFTLTPRKRWDQVPKGFDIKDIYPWRYGRRLSFVTRPM